MGMGKSGADGASFLPPFFPLPTPPPPSLPQLGHGLYTTRPSAQIDSGERVCERKRAVRGSKMGWGWAHTHFASSPNFTLVPSLPITPSLSPRSFVIAIGKHYSYRFMWFRVSITLLFPVLNPNPPHSSSPFYPSPGHPWGAINRQTRPLRQSRWK